MEKSRFLGSEKRFGSRVGNFALIWDFGDFGVERSWTNIEPQRMILSLLTSDLSHTEFDSSLQVFGISLTALCHSKLDCLSLSLSLKVASVSYTCKL